MTDVTRRSFLATTSAAAATVALAPIVLADAWIRPGETAALPPARVVHGGSAFDLFARYRADNGIDTWPGLREKLSAPIHATLARSVHLKVDMWQPTGGTWATGKPEVAFDCLSAVPGGPYSVELASYYADGRHDHNYPDFLTFDYLGGSARFKEPAPRGSAATGCSATSAPASASSSAPCSRTGRTSTTTPTGTASSSSSGRSAPRSCTTGSPSTRTTWTGGSIPRRT
ncbi:twin-arginine translocation signal domain-containing protein [Streptosporangium amethystogenes]|uniref:twin-arginine translocation signal domain-containing protein n=1 Tax=Streptosporangium amethystogenes TaxID=2002 RepID=UPI0014701A65|nr:twin-arginine translocation signal domain-containing protein [Streptosporangium amethystogenes]